MRTAWVPAVAGMTELETAYVHIATGYTGASSR